MGGGAASNIANGKNDAGLDLKCHDAEMKKMIFAISVPALDWV